MPKSIEQLVHSAVQTRFPSATAISVLESRRLDERDPLPTHLLRVKWTNDGLTQMEPFVVRCETAIEAAKEGVLLPELASNQVPVPQVLLVEAFDGGSYLVQESVSGQPLAQSLTEASMRWELSALGFSYARLLAQIHALDWKQVAPWMGDPEALPEDLVDDQLNDWWVEWEEHVARCPDPYQAAGEAALQWLDEHRPVDFSVCLCHGDYRPLQVLMDGDDVRAVVGWSHALVTDASYDLALLPFDIRQLGLPPEDSDLLHQAIIGSYLQSSPRAIGNAEFYAVARLLSAGLQSLEQGLDRHHEIAAFSSDPDELFAAMREVMAGGRKPLWRP